MHPTFLMASGTLIAFLIETVLAEFLHSLFKSSGLFEKSSSDLSDGLRDSSEAR